MHTFAAMSPSERTGSPNCTDVWRTRIDALGSDDRWLFDQPDHRTKDEYWAAKDVAIEDIDVPTLAVGGFRDYFPHATLAQAGGDRRAGPSGRGRGDTPCPTGAQKGQSRFDDGFSSGSTTSSRTETRTRSTADSSSTGPNPQVWRQRESWPTVRGVAPAIRSFVLTPGSTGLTLVANYDSEPLAAEYEFDNTVGMDSVFNRGPPAPTTQGRSPSKPARSPRRSN
jgi:predicted acyl esterase